MRIDVLRYIQDKIGPILYRRSIDDQIAKKAKVGDLSSAKTDVKNKNSR